MGIRTQQAESCRSRFDGTDSAPEAPGGARHSACKPHRWQPLLNPHIQRPAFYPPSDGYQPPEDPLIGVSRQMQMTRELKKQFPRLIFVGSAYSYLQDFLPNVAQAAIRERWVDVVGMGRMVLTYPELLWE